MAPPTDPYRTLGLPRDASRDEVRRAYRRLAKENHPDAAGPAALPRFLAIQAAYEAIIRGRVGRAGAGGTGAAGGGGAAGGAGGAPRASSADPARADATHRAYAGRSRRARPSGGTTGSPRSRSTGPSPAGGSPGGTGTGSAGPSSTWTGSGAGSEAGQGAGQGTGSGRRARGKATLGSTSYDGADAGPFEPDWGGASWYGTTSGTYWTLNPKEYADPRKHGPEYQARARRAAAAASASAGARAGAVPGETATADDDAPPRTTEPEEDARPDDPVHTTSSWWGASADEMAGGRAGTGGPTHDEPWTTATPQPPAAARATPRSDDPAPPDIGAMAKQLGHLLTDERAARGWWRLAQAVLGWLPIAFGVSWVIGELTGCSRSAASCDGSDPWLAPVIAAATIVPLLLVPRLAALAAAGAIGVAIAAVPAAVMLSATSDEGSMPVRAMLLGLVLVVAWFVGIGVAVGRRVRAGPSAGGPDPAPGGDGGPVS